VKNTILSGFAILLGSLIIAAPIAFSQPVVVGNGGPAQFTTGSFSGPVTINGCTFTSSGSIMTSSCEFRTASGQNIQSGNSVLSGTNSGNGFATLSGTGVFAEGNTIFSAGTPVITGAGTAPSATGNNGNAAFRVNVGTGGTATGFTATFSQTTGTRYVCTCKNITTLTTLTEIVQTGGTTTTCVMEQRTRSTNAALAFGASDLVECTGAGY
jgi:hypothetical protein